MRPSPTALRHACALLSTVLLAALLVAASGAPSAHDLRATSGSTYLCAGYAGCRSEGFSDAGYGAVNDRSYWNMYPGHNCTNYVAYRMIRAGMSPQRPFGYPGNATNWGDHMSDRVDGTPRVGAVAWWRAHDNGSGSAGHVAYVERVTSDYIVISEDSWGGTFHWRRIDRGSYRWPTGFIHFIDRTIESTSRPSLTGHARLGEQVRATSGGWNPEDVQVSYRWFAGDQRIWGERGDTITLGPDHIGKRVRAMVVAKKTGWDRAWRRTAWSRQVQPGVISVTARPRIIGTPARGEELLVEGDAFSPQPDSVDVQWLADGEPVDGATDRRLKLTADHVGAKISARVTAHRANHADRVVTTPATDWVREGFVEVTDEPTITGRTKVNKVLTVQPGTVEPARGVRTSYQWLRNGVPIEGATGEQYRLTPADFASSVGVRSTYAHADRYSTVSEVTRGRLVRAGTGMDVRTRIRGKYGHQVVFIVDVDPWLVDTTFTGEVTVRFDGRAQRVSVDDGRAWFRFRGVPHGTQGAVVRQHPNARFLGSRHRISVEVQR